MSYFLIVHKISFNPNNPIYFTKLDLCLVFIIILAKLSILYIPYTRGYLFISLSDTLTHVGLISDIIRSGHCSINIYPVVHIIIATLSMVTGISLEYMSIIYVPILSILYLLFIFLFARAIFHDRIAQLFSVIAIIPIFSHYHYAISPNGMSILYLPLMFFLLCRSNPWDNSVNIQILITILLILFPLFHVLTGLMLVMFLIIIYFLRSIGIPSINLKFNQVLLVTCVLLLWITSFKYFNPNIIGLYNSIKVGSNSIYLIEATEKLDMIDIHGLHIITFAMKYMGQDIIFALLSMLGIVLILKQIYLRDYTYINLLPWSIIILFILILYSAGVIGLIGIESIAGHRILMYLVAISPIFAGFIILYSLQNRRFFFYILLTLIILASFLSIFNLYDSPYVSRPTEKTSAYDTSGILWFSAHKYKELCTDYIVSNPFRLADLTLGTEARATTNIEKYNSQKLPDGFNYINYPYLGLNYDTDIYAIIRKIDTIVYNTVWKSVDRFDYRDFRKLNTDITANKLYSNLEFEVYYVKGVKAIGYSGSF